MINDYFCEKNVFFENFPLFELIVIPHCTFNISELRSYVYDDLKAKFDTNEVEGISYNDTLTKNSKGVTSMIWKSFHRLLDTVNNVLVLNFTICIFCKDIVGFNGKSSTQLLRHDRKCTQKPANSSNGRSKIKFNSEDLVPLRDAAAKFVCIDFRPAFGVNGRGLTEYLYAAIQLAKLYPNMTMDDLSRAIPSRNTVTTHILKLANESVNIVTEMLRTVIQDYGCFGITTDLWTEQLNTTSFIAITVHFFVQSPAGLELKSLVIDLFEMTCDAMTAANIKDTIINLFAAFGITVDDLMQHACFVTDRGSNIRSAVSEFEHHPCLAHLCNNVVDKMLGGVELKKIVSNASNLVKYVKKSNIASQLTSKLKGHVETRWNSVYDMLISIIENYQELHHILETKQETSSRNSNVLDKLTCLSVHDMKAVCSVLVFFKNVSTAVEGDKYVTLHNYWVVLREMKKTLLPNRSDPDLVKSMKSAGLDYIERSERAGHFLPTFRQKMAMFLHPQMKGLNCASIDERKEIHEHVKSLIDVRIESTVTIEPTTNAMNGTSASLFQGYYDIHDVDRDDNNNSNNELERYIVNKVEMVTMN